jgi:hypothetical protein
LEQQNKSDFDIPFINAVIFSHLYVSGVIKESFFPFLVGGDSPPIPPFLGTPFL